MRQCFLLFLLLGICTNLFSQSIDERLQTHQEAYHLEKIYISHNQPYYAPGDTLYGKIFLVNGRNHLYFDGTPLVYVDLITESGIIQISHTVKIKNGTGNLFMPLSNEYGEGNYALRAYTQYQKNFDEDYIFQKEIKVIGEAPLSSEERVGDKSDFSVQFFPEGGQLVAGLATTMAFKAVNGKGKPIDVVGELLNKNKTPVAQFKSYNEGVGVINFKPESGEKYVAKVTRNGQVKEIAIPQMLKEGYVLKANNRKKDNLSLEIMTNTKDGLNNCILIGHLRGQPFLSQTLTEGNSQKLLLDKSQIPSGVLHFTLFDSKERPVCERLVFNNNPAEQVTVNIDVPKTQFGVKELVETSIAGQLGEKTVEGDFTISVFNKDIFASGLDGINLKNYLLLQSDLKGDINNINQYFEKDDAKSRTLLDYLMLTQGWRRFNWQDVLTNTPTPIVFPTEESTSFAGKVMKDNNRDVPVKADVFLSILDGKNFASTNLTTDEDGLFYFKGFDLPDSTEVLLQGNIYSAKKKAKLKNGEAKRTGNKNVKFELLDLHNLEYDDSITLKSIPYNREEQTLFATEVNRIRKVDTIYHPEWTIDLDAVTVSAQRLAESRKKEAVTKKKFKDRGLFYSASSQKVYMDDLVAGGATYQSVYDVIRDRVPSAKIIGAGDDRQVLLRAQSSFTIPTYAAIELNGVIVSGPTAAAIVPTDIDMIDVKRGLAASSIYGEAGKGGVITIITKDPQANTRNIRTPGIIRVEHPGYHQARTFYTPDYSVNGFERQKPDYRTTLYWNANAKLGKKPTNLKFYTGDKLSQFLIFVEGITSEGLPFVGQQVIQVGQ